MLSATFHLFNKRSYQLNFYYFSISFLLLYKYNFFISKKHEIKESVFKNITDYLPEECVLIFNDTRVIQARLFFQTAKEQKIEVFCLEPFNGAIDITQAMLSTKTVLWNCLVGNLKKWRESNPGLPGEKQECCLLCYAAPHVTKYLCAVHL